MLGGHRRQQLLSPEARAFRPQPRERILRAIGIIYRSSCAFDERRNELPRISRARPAISNFGAGVMIRVWLKNGSGELLPHFTSGSPLEVDRKLVPPHYDAFRLQVSSSYRELLDGP
jgi:hypothetical protein